MRTGAPIFNPADHRALRLLAIGLGAAALGECWIGQNTAIRLFAVGLNGFTLLCCIGVISLRRRLRSAALSSKE